MKRVNLLEGPIFPALTKLALPIMATGMVQMAYNMTDMIWIGRISSDAVAAVGAAGMFMWLANGLTTLAKTGGQIKVGHMLGSGEEGKAVQYATSSFQLSILFALVYSAVMLLFTGPLIGFFRLNSPEVIHNAEIYLRVVSAGIIFSFLNQIYTAVMTAMGNSQTIFFATTTGLVLNIVLDPVLIFGIGPFPTMGVAGAALATVIAQAVVTLVFFLSVLKDTVIFCNIKLFSKPDKESIGVIIKLGLPTSIQSMVFTGISMVIARLIAGWGDAAVAVQKVGSQIESISWMTADGFAAAVNSFVAQNHGARNEKRVYKGYATAMVVVLIWGFFCTCVLTFLPGPIFQIFIHEEAVLPMGVDYLKILAISQLLMCVEITTAGAFQGLGKTMPPSVVGIVFTAARIPMAMVLMKTALGLNGVWWSITISSNLKGFILFAWFMVFVFKRRKSMKNLQGEV